MTEILTDAQLPVWTFRPNWAGDVLERLVFLTDLLVSNSAAEQRRGIRATPRRQFEFDLMLTDRERAFFDLTIMSLGDSHFMLPIWHDLTGTTAAAGIGDDVLMLPTAGREFEEGGYAVLITNALTYERVEIVTILSDRLELADTLGRAWAKGSKVYPLKRARLEEQPTHKSKTGTVATSTLSFQLVRENLWTGDPGLAVFLGFPVLDTAPNRVDDLDYVYSRLTDELDGEAGLPWRVDKADRGFVSQAYSWLIYGRTDNNAFRDLIYSLDGRRKALWVPTFNDDLKVIERQLADTSGSVQQDHIDFQATGYRLALGGAGAITGREYVRIGLVDGTFIYRKILRTETAGVAAGRERIVMTPWLTALSTDPLPAIKSVQFMNLMRLDSDTIEIAHKTDAAGTSVVEATFKSYRDGDTPTADSQHISGAESNVGQGVTVMYEIATPHGDPVQIFHGLAHFMAHIPEVDGTLGDDSTDHLDLTFPVDMQDVLALVGFSADYTVAPVLTPSGWTDDGNGFHAYANNYAYAFAHKRFNSGSPADVTATWAASSRRVTGLMVLLNGATIVQSASAPFDILTDGGAFVDLPQVPTSGNWLVQLTMGDSGLGIANIHAEPHWERWVKYSELAQALVPQVYYRRIP